MAAAAGSPRRAAPCRAWAPGSTRDRRPACSCARHASAAAMGSVPVVTRWPDRAHRSRWADAEPQRDHDQTVTQHDSCVVMGMPHMSLQALDGRAYAVAFTAARPSAAPGGRSHMSAPIDRWLEEYARGQLSRRDFIRRTALAGLTFSATYSLLASADALAQSPAASRAPAPSATPLKTTTGLKTLGFSHPYPGTGIYRGLQKGLKQEGERL